MSKEPLDFVPPLPPKNYKISSAFSYNFISALTATDEMEPAMRMMFGRLEITPEQVLVTKDGLPIELTQREFDLLCYLAQKPGKVIPREELLKQVWEYSYMGDTRNVDVTCIYRTESPVCTEY